MSNPYRDDKGRFSTPEDAKSKRRRPREAPATPRAVPNPKPDPYRTAPVPFPTRRQPPATGD